MFDAMSTFWQRFAETGDPNPRGVAGAVAAVPAAGPSRRLSIASRSDRYFVFGDSPGREHAICATRSATSGSRSNFRSVLGVVPAAAR